METNILMESGTNELEVLEFIVGGNHYGINVAKIKEIVPYSKVTTRWFTVCSVYSHIIANRWYLVTKYWIM